MSKKRIFLLIGSLIAVFAAVTLDLCYASAHFAGEKKEEVTAISYIDGNAVTPLYAGDISAQQLTLAVLPSDKIYGEGDPEFDYGIAGGGLKSGHIISALGFSRTEGEDVGQYDVNIDVSKVVISNAAGNDVTAEYSILQTSNELTINKAAVTVTSKSATIKYGQSFTPEIIGAQPSYYGNTMAVVFMEIDTYFIGTKNIEFTYSFSNAGTDTTEAMKKNVTVNVAYGVLTTEKRTITVTPEDGISCRYGETLTIPYDAAGDCAPGETLTGTLSRTNSTNKNTGVYDVTVGTLKVCGEGGADKSDFYDIILIEKKAAITPKTISVTFNDISVVYGGGEPDLSAYNSVLQGQLCYGEFADAVFVRQYSYNHVVGNYSIILSRELGNNYQVNLSNATIRINRSDLQIVPSQISKQYGAEDPVYGFIIVSGQLFYDDVIDMYYNREAGETIGNYVMNIDSDKCASQNVAWNNYNVVMEKCSFSIVPKRLTVVGFIVANKVYDGTTKAYLYNTPELVGVLDGEEVTLNNTYYAEFSDEKPADGKSVTVYGLELSGADKNNYSIADLVLSSNITPRTVSGNSVEIIADDYSTIKNGTQINVVYKVADNRRGFSKSAFAVDYYNSVLATYDVSLYYNDELYNVEGFFNIAIDIPEKFEKIYDLKITAVDSDGNTILLNTIRKDGKLIVSTSGEYSQFAIVAKSNLWKIITASILGGLSLLICVYLIVLVVKKKKHIAKT